VDAALLSGEVGFIGSDELDCLLWLLERNHNWISSLIDPTLRKSCRN